MSKQPVRRRAGPAVRADRPTTQLPRSLRLLAILEAAAASEVGVTLAQLTQRLSAPKSSLLLLLKPLVAHGYLSHELGVYRLSSASFRHANIIRGNRTFPSLLRPLLTELWKRSNETVYIAVLDRAYKCCTYVEGIESPAPVRYAVPVGSTRPLYCTSGGRVLLAYQDRAWRESYFTATELRQVTPRTTTDPRRLEAELEDIRQLGYVVTLEQGAPGAGGVAAPIWGPEGLVGAFVIAVPVARLRENLQTLTELAVDTAREASQLLGGRPSDVRAAAA